MNPAPSHKDSILIIDHCEAILDVMQLVLEKQGYEVFVKTNPDDLYEFIQDNKIALMFLDVLLQGESGRQVCKQLKSDPATAYFPIILMSAAPAYLQNYVQYKADDILEKPFDINMLLSKVNLLHS